MSFLVQLNMITTAQEFLLRFSDYNINILDIIYHTIIHKIYTGSFSYRIYRAFQKIIHLIQIYIQLKSDGSFLNTLYYITQRLAIYCTAAGINKLNDFFLVFVFQTLPIIYNGSISPIIYHADTLPAYLMDTLRVDG